MTKGQSTNYKLKKYLLTLA